MGYFSNHSLVKVCVVEDWTAGKRKFADLFGDDER